METWTVSTWRREVGLALLVSLIPQAILLGFALGSSDFTLVRDDGLSNNLPLTDDALRQCLSGQLPLWSHHTVCGYPLWARSTLYPVHFLAHGTAWLFGRPEQVMEISYHLHLYAACIFAWLYLRYLGASGLCAAIGAFSFTLCGPNLGFWTNWPEYLFMATYIPLAFLIVEQQHAGKSERFWTPVWGLCAALIVLLNSPIVIIKFFLLVGAYFLLRMDRATWWRSLRGFVGGIAIAIVINLGQMLAASELILMTDRVSDDMFQGGNIYLMSIQPLKLAGMIWPFFEVPWNWTFYHAHDFTGGGVFAGPLAVFALLYVFVSGRPMSGPQRTLFFLITLTLLFSLGAYLSLNDYIQKLPLIRFFRWPVRWTLEVCGLSGLFTGLALEQLRRHFSDRRARVAGGIFFLVVAALALGLGRLPEKLDVALGVLQAVWVAFAALLFAFLWRKTPGLYLGTATAFTLVSLTLNTPVAQQNQFSSRDFRSLYRDPIVLEDLGQDRVLYLATPEDVRVAEGEQSFGFSLPHFFGGRSVLGYRFRTRPERWASAAGTQGMVEDIAAAEETFLSKHLLETLRVGYVIVPRGSERFRHACDAHPALRLDRELHWVAIYRNVGFHEPAFFVSRVRHETDIAPLELGQHPLASVCFAESDYSGPEYFESGKVEDFQEQHGNIDMTIDSPNGGFVVVTTTWYPGWHAAVDGSEVPIHRVNGSFMGLAVPAGRHHVEMRYRPMRLILLMRLGIGIGIALSGYVGLATAARLMSNRGMVSAPFDGAAVQ